MRAALRRDAAYCRYCRGSHLGVQEAIVFARNDVSQLLVEPHDPLQVGSVPCLQGLEAKHLERKVHERQRGLGRLRTPDEARLPDESTRFAAGRSPIDRFDVEESKGYVARARNEIPIALGIETLEP